MSDKKEIKFKPGVGVDIGTSNLVVSRQTEDGTFVNKFHRNMLFPLDITDESADLIERSGYFFVKTDKSYYIIGEDALSLINAIGDSKSKIIRPMENGLLNANLQKSSDLLFVIIKAIVGDPIIPNENLRFTVPANSVDKDNDNLFHQMILSNFFTKLGFNAKPVNESATICYDCCPIMKLDGQEIPLTGICISMGGGMWNIGLFYKGLSLVEFSCTRSGDFLDQQVEKVSGVPSSKVIKIKEKKLDLDNVDMQDPVQSALSIYYDEMIGRMVHHIVNKFKDKSSELEGEIEIVVAGGSSLAKGFIKRFEAIIQKSDMPFRIYRVRHSLTPFFSVSQGACIRALADQMKATK